MAVFSDEERAVLRRAMGTLNMRAYDRLDVPAQLSGARACDCGTDPWVAWELGLLEGSVQAAIGALNDILCRSAELERASTSPSRSEGT